MREDSAGVIPWYGRVGLRRHAPSPDGPRRSPSLVPTTVPGSHTLGAVTAAAVASRCMSRRLEAADQFVAYVGRDIGVMQSGPRNGQRGRTKEGEAAWRRLFSRCAQSTVRQPSSPFRGCDYQVR